MVRIIVEFIPVYMVHPISYVSTKQVVFRNFVMCQYSQSMPLQHEFYVRVYYPHTDAGGVVYHGQYLAFADMARTELLRTVGINLHNVYEKTGVLIMVKSVDAQYMQSARLDDELRIVTTVLSINGASAHLRQDVYKETYSPSEQLVENQQTENLLSTRMHIHLVCVGHSYKPVRWPPDIKKALNQFKAP